MLYSMYVSVYRTLSTTIIIIITTATTIIIIIIIIIIMMLRQRRRVLEESGKICETNITRNIAPRHLPAWDWSLCEIVYFFCSVDICYKPIFCSERQNVLEVAGTAKRCPNAKCSWKVAAHNRNGLNGNDKGSNNLHVIQIYNKVSTRL